MRLLNKGLTESVYRRVIKEGSFGDEVGFSYYASIDEMEDEFTSKLYSFFGMEPSSLSFSKFELHRGTSWTDDNPWMLVELEGIDDIVEKVIQEGKDKYPKCYETMQTDDLVIYSSGLEIGRNHGNRSYYDVVCYTTLDRHYLTYQERSEEQNKAIDKQISDEEDKISAYIASVVKEHYKELLGIMLDNEGTEDEEEMYESKKVRKSKKLKESFDNLTLEDLEGMVKNNSDAQVALDDLEQKALSDEVVDLINSKHFNTKDEVIGFLGASDEVEKLRNENINEAAETEYNIISEDEVEAYLKKNKKYIDTIERLWDQLDKYRPDSPDVDNDFDMVYYDIESYFDNDFYQDGPEGEVEWTEEEFKEYIDYLRDLVKEAKEDYKTRDEDLDESKKVRKSKKLKEATDEELEKLKKELTHRSKELGYGLGYGDINRLAERIAQTGFFIANDIFTPDDDEYEWEQLNMYLDAKIRDYYKECGPVKESKKVRKSKKLKESSAKSKKDPVRGYGKYVLDWVNDHGYADEFHKIYSSPKYKNMSDEDRMRAIFDDLADENGFNGELFASYNEWLDNEYLEEATIPRNAKRIKVGDFEYSKDGSSWKKNIDPEEMSFGHPVRYGSDFLRSQGDVEVIEVDKDYKPKRTKEYKVLQGNYGSGWDDLVSYDTSDEKQLADLRQNIKDYKENEPQYPHRVITRRMPLDERYFPGAEEQYFCRDCGHAFDEDELSGVDDDGNDLCPACGSKNIVDTGKVGVDVEPGNQVGLWVNGKVYWEGNRDDVDETLIMDVADQASEEDGKTYDYDEVDIRPLDESATPEEVEKVKEMVRNPELGSVGSIEEINGKKYYVSDSTFNGYCYKDMDAYYNRPDDVCYICEGGFDDGEDGKLSVDFVNSKKEELINWGSISTRNSIFDDVRTKLDYEEFDFTYDDGRVIKSKDFDDKLIEILADEVIGMVDWQSVNAYVMEQEDSWLSIIDDYYNNKLGNMNESEETGFTVSPRLPVKLNSLVKFVSDPYNRELFNSDGIDEDLISYIKNIQRKMFSYSSKEDFIKDVNEVIEFVKECKNYFYDAIDLEIFDYLKDLISIVSGNMNESAKPKKKKESKEKKDEKRVVMQQGNVTCFKENDGKFLVFENENDNEVEYKDQDSAMKDFMNRVGVDPNGGLTESKK